MLCWPSVQHLSDMTEQDRKTVIDNIKRLCESGHIVDTKERRGVTGQVPVYLLNTPKNGTVIADESVPETVPEFPTNSTESGTVTKSETVPLFPTNSTVFPYEQSRFSLSTVPKTGHGTSNEPVNEPVKKKEDSASAPSIPDISESLFADFQKIRKAKKAPLTNTAIEGIRREAKKAGLTMEQAITVAVERNWQAFRADWMVEKRSQAQAAQSFRERDIDIGRARWEEMTGETHPDKQKNVIDITPTFLERLA